MTMSSSPATPWVHDDVPDQPQPMEYDEAGIAQLTALTPTPTSHPLDTPTQSVVVGRIGGNNPIDDAAAPRAEP